MSRLFVLIPFLFLILSLFSSCSEEDGTSLLTVVNNSSNTETYSALRFDGGADYINQTGTTFGMVDSDAGVFTIAMWLKPNAAATMGIFSLNANSGMDRFDIIMTSSREIEVVFNDSSSTHTFTSTGKITLDESNFVVVTADTGTVSIYINGSLAETPTGVGPTVYASGSPDIRIGIDSDTTPSDFFSGDIHAVAYWPYLEMGSTAVDEIYNNSDLGFDLKTNSENYTDSASLGNWWQLGADETNIGEDHGGDSWDLNEGTMTAGNIVSYP